MLKLLTLTTGITLALSSYSGLAGTGHADFSAAITARMPAGCHLELIPPTSVDTVIRYTKGESGMLGRMYVISHIEGPIEVTVSGNTACRVGRVEFGVDGERHNLNGKYVFGGKSRNGRAIFPYLIGVNSVHAYLGDASADAVSHTAGRPGGWSTGILDGHYGRYGWSGTRMEASDNSLQTHHGFPVREDSMYFAGNVSSDLKYILDLNEKVPDWNAPKADRLSLTVGIALAEHPYSLETGYPDESLVDEGEHVESTATVIVTQA